MNGKDLLTGMSFVNTKFIMEAENEYMEKSGQGLTVRGTVKRTLLIAAIITAMVLMMGSAAAMLYLQDLEIGEIEQPRYYDEKGQHIAPTEVTKAVISLRGYQDTPNYLATKEWYAFEQNYDPNDEILHAYEDFSLDNYQVYQNIYGCYSPEMADKVDEIAQKYGLKLLSQETVVQRWQTDIMFDAMGIDGVCHDEKCARVSDGAGYFYAEGNFKYEFEFLLPQGNDSWSHEVWANLLYTKKDYFDPDYSIVDTELYEQWQYTTSDGVDVLIAKSYGGAMIFAEQEDACLTVMLNTNMMLDEPETPSNRDLELMAEVIDFTIRPQAPDMSDMNAKLEQADKEHEEQQAAAAQKNAQTYTGYAQYIQEKYIDGSDNIIGTPFMRNYYALRDVNGDGVDELMLGEGNDHFRDLWTIENGELCKINCWATMILCEDNIILITQEDPIYGITCYWYGTVDGVEMVTQYELVYIDEDGYEGKDGAWYSCIEEEYVPITEEEMQEIIGSYTVIDLEMKPITEFPMG